MQWKRGVAAISVLAFAAASTAATAGERVDLDNGWPAGWRRVGTEETWAIGGLSAASLALRLFSNAAYVLTAVPFMVDAMFVTWLGHGQMDAAVQLALIDIETLAITTLMTTALQRAVGRARPFLRECASNPNSDSDCAGSANNRNSSFISGHASLAFSAATTLCVQHSRLSLYGSADPVVCPAALTIAAGSSLLRVVADRHWISDVIAGAVLGSAVGYVVSAVHLRENGSAPAGLTMGERGNSLVYWRAF